MHKRSNYVINLIDAYRRADAPRIPSPSLTDREVNHLYNFGLASIALRGLGPDLANVPENSREILRTADLTARVVYGQLRTTTIEILEIAHCNDIPVVLLKGISLAEDLYLEPHHRIMGDVDILVPVDKADDLKRLLIEIGYRIPEDSKTPEGHHHLPILRHPGVDIAVEVHTALFSTTPLASEQVFRLSSLWALTDPSDFHGMHCLKFRPELQLMYTVAHWAVDQKLTANVISINDVVLMMRQNDRPMDWVLIESWLTASPLLADYFAVILLFLKKVGIAEIPAAIRAQTKKSARRIGSINMKVLHWLLYTFPLSGRTKVAWAVTSQNARVIWKTLLEPRHKSARLMVAVARIIFRRTPGKSLLSSTVGRIRTLLESND